VPDRQCQRAKAYEAVTNHSVPHPSDTPHHLLSLMCVQVAAAVVLRHGWTWRPEGCTAGVPALSGRPVTLTELQQHCRTAGLASFKLPRLVAALQDLPRNSSGKVLKAGVRELLLASQPRSAL
jgi:non-ribosomal peptide synthetase component E (peptide arylation enzyme)